MTAEAPLYLWTGFHVFIALGLLRFGIWIHERGVLSWPRDLPWFILPAIIVLFVTAYVIPWVFFDRGYRRAE